jgi:hypothetical protein
MWQLFLCRLTGIVNCSVATVQLHQGDAAIALSRQCNQFNGIKLANYLVEWGKIANFAG